MSNDKSDKKVIDKKAHAAKSKNYRTRLKNAVEKGDVEGVVKSLMLLAIRVNDDNDFKASPRTWMELLQVLVKYKSEFGTGDDDFADVLKVISGGKDDE